MKGVLCILYNLTVLSLTLKDVLMLAGVAAFRLISGAGGEIRPTQNTRTSCVSDCARVTML